MGTVDLDVERYILRQPCMQHVTVFHAETNIFSPTHYGGASSSWPHCVLQGSVDRTEAGQLGEGSSCRTLEKDSQRIQRRNKATGEESWVETAVLGEEEI